MAETATYNSLADSANWSTFDATSIAAGASGFCGATFDGRYIYFSPSYNGTQSGLVVRYDTQGIFTSLSSWLTFDTSTLDANASGFSGVTSDGRYLYFVPNRQTSPIVARYDTQAPFDTPSSWALFDLSALGPGVNGYFGATFDERYVYFSPSFSSTVARYDTQAPFTSATSWQIFDLTATSTMVQRANPSFDGRYVYFPGWLANLVVSGVITRYDTTASFVSAASWEVFDSNTVDPLAKGYGGSAFDGTYIYLFPFLLVQGQANGTAVRYDPRAGFASTTSWQTFDATTIEPQAKGYIGGTFDGRRLIMAPYPGSMVTAYDSTQEFTSPSSWSFFDITSIDASGSGYYGAVFDGRHVYFVSHAGGTIARFEARTPPGSPDLPGFHGGFL